MKTLLTALVGAATLATASAGTDAAANSINAFGLNLHRRLGSGNAVTSPWSIESALAMTYAGASGKTKAEMAAVLHFPGDGDIHAGFAGIAAGLQELAAQSAERVRESGKRGGPSTPLEITAANRLFGQKGYAFEAPFLALAEKSYGAPLEPVDFKTAAHAARKRINGWVETQTKERIKDLIPDGVLTRDTRLVLTNAVYFKSPWASEFRDEAAAPFWVNGAEAVKVPGLVQENRFGYAALPGGAAVTVPYAGGGLQFVLFVPDRKDGLAAMEKSLTPALLQQAAKAPARDILLHFPKFKLEPPRVMLADQLVAMGMPAAFDKPRGSADFSGIAPRLPDEYLYLSEVIHKAFIAVDKHGTEAAAATAVVMMRALAMPAEKPRPLEVRVDRPFAFAVQHTASGACLFLGRVTDPR